MCTFHFSYDNSSELYNHDGGGSGGYLENIMKFAASELFDHPVDQLTYKTLRWDEYMQSTEQPVLPNQWIFTGLIPQNEKQ